MAGEERKVVGELEEQQHLSFEEVRSVSLDYFWKGSYLEADQQPRNMMLHICHALLYLEKSTEYNAALSFVCGYNMMIANEASLPGVKEFERKFQIELSLLRSPSETLLKKRDYWRACLITALNARGDLAPWSGMRDFLQYLSAVQNNNPNIEKMKVLPFATFLSQNGLTVYHKSSSSSSVQESTTRKRKSSSSVKRKGAARRRLKENSADESDVAKNIEDIQADEAEVVGSESGDQGEEEEAAQQSQEEREQHAGFVDERTDSQIEREGETRPRRVSRLSAEGAVAIRKLKEYHRRNSRLIVRILELVDKTNLSVSEILKLLE